MMATSGWTIVDTTPSEAPTEGSDSEEATKDRSLEILWSDWSDSEATKDSASSDEEEYQYECASDDDDDVNREVYNEKAELDAAILETARDAGQLYRESTTETTEDLVPRLAQDHDEHIAHALASRDDSKFNPTSGKDPTAGDEALARELAAQDEAAFQQGSQANATEQVQPSGDDLDAEVKPKSIRWCQTEAEKLGHGARACFIKDVVNHIERMPWGVTGYDVNGNPHYYINNPNDHIATIVESFKDFIQKEEREMDHS